MLIALFLLHLAMFLLHLAIYQLRDVCLCSEIGKFHGQEFAKFPTAWSNMSHGSGKARRL
jgi:hypothetical protein